jgi:hypothetical protein
VVKRSNNSIIDIVDRPYTLTMKINLFKSVALSLVVDGLAFDDCPGQQVRCGAYDGFEGVCTSLCCDIMTEDTCYDEITSEPSYCAKISEGGCPCPSGQVRCGMNEYSIGYCTDVCCDWEYEETCYNPRTRRSKCARIEEGGCATQSNNVITCNSDTEETCYDNETNPISCAPLEVGW